MRQVPPLLAFALLVCLTLLACGCGDNGTKPTGEGGPEEPPSILEQPARTGGAGIPKELAEEIAASIGKGRTFLLTQREPSGGFTDRNTEKMQANVSFTAMAVIHVIAIYCGVPQGLECFRAARKVLEEEGLL